MLRITQPALDDRHRGGAFDDAGMVFTVNDVHLAVNVPLLYRLGSSGVQVHV
jgi:hypothetical protein